MNIKTIAILLLLTALIACRDQKKPIAQTVRIELAPNAGPLAQRSSDILSREITDRSSAKVTKEGEADLTIQLKVQPSIGAEGFTIADNNGKVVITGNDENGLLYGVGKFLHTSRYDQGGFTPGDWHGTSVPKGTVRGMYFASHFKNYYEKASDQDLLKYIEDQALWGTNALVLATDNFMNLNDSKVQESVRKLKFMMNEAKKTGMRVGIILEGNCGNESTPRDALFTPGVWTQTMGDNLICPSKPKGRELLLNNCASLLETFADPGLDYIIYWPYDAGGCACKDCLPWGSNGFARICRDYSRIIREKSPKTKIVLSTWMFDDDRVLKDGYTKLRTDGEFAGLATFLDKDNSWLDYLMVDACKDFPQYPFKVRVPGNLPMINFPEISMWGHGPWGGFGANPEPERFQRIWDQSEHKMVGGFPYSEGIYEDINKIIASQFYWSPEQNDSQTVREYINYEYSPDVTDSVMKAIGLLEKNITRDLDERRRVTFPSEDGNYEVFLEGTRVVFQNPDHKTPLSPEGLAKFKQDAEEAFRLLDGADKKLSPQAKAGWRWRILYLRGLVDKELANQGGWIEGPVLKDAFAELTKIYHCENAYVWVHVPRIDDPNVKYSGKTKDPKQTVKTVTQ